MKILDLFSGLGGFSQAFIEAGDEVITVDLEKRFNPRLLSDVRDLTLYEDGWDIVLASPPCEAFSVAGLPHHWKSHVPDQHVSHGLALVAATFRTIAQTRPKAWFLENPTGMLRKLIGAPRETIYLCSYGARWKKPTDIWGLYPKKLAKPCGPHEAAPRGSKSGINGPYSAAERAKLPYALSETIRSMLIPVST